jgi:hypothetical protein
MKSLVFIGLFAVFSSNTQACEFEQVSFSSEFEMGKLDSCKQLTTNSFLLKSKPENRPINHSPWYAFNISAKSPQKIEIQIEFEQESPRYIPKISSDGKDWRSADFDVSQNRFVLSLDVGQKPLWIAGQELIDNATYDQWIAKMLESSDLDFLELGLSTQKRSLNALLSKGEVKREWIVLLGRQHPPEVTGALAMFPFTEQLLGQSELAQKFKARFNLLIVPNVNPDGVAQGHWRHNVNGIDLNRDWGKFTQVETKIIANRLQQLVSKGAKFVMAIDFHSTQQDIFYTMPTDYGMVPATLVTNWLDQLQRRTVSSFIVRNKPGSSPGRGVFKQYFTDTYKVHAITYEMGDNTNRNLITHVAKQAADSLMQTLLATDPKAFYQ